MRYGNICIGLGLILFLLPALSSAQVKDTLFMINGQVLIGELKSIALGKVEFKSDDVTTASLKSNKIKTIIAISHLYRVETIDHFIFYTSLEKASEGYVLVNKVDTLMELAIDHISDLIPLRSQNAGLWRGTISSGYSYSKSSNIGQFNADVSLAYLRKKVENLFQGSAIITQTDTTLEVDNASASWLGSYLLTPTWEIIGLIKYQRNLELGLARRYQEGLTIGYDFLSSTVLDGTALSGAAISQERNTDGVKTSSQLEIPFIVIFDFFHFQKPDMTLNITQSLYAGVTQKGRFRQDGNISLNIKIITDFWINLKLYDSYDNQPPSGSSTKFDFGVAFGLSYKFSQ